jgi:hypothetical protein
MRKDVLIETRHGSDYLAMYNDFVDGQLNRIPKCKEEQVHKNYPEFVKPLPDTLLVVLRAAFKPGSRRRLILMDQMRLLHM